MMHILLVAAEVVGALTALITFAALLIRPLRRRIFTDKAAREGHKCLLRDAILRIYYHGQATESLRQYDYTMRSVLLPGKIDWFLCDSGETKLEGNFVI